MKVWKRNRMTRAERAALVAAFVVPALAWPAIIALVQSMSVGWQLLIVAVGLGMFALRIILGFLAAVAGLICRR